MSMSQASAEAEILLEFVSGYCKKDFLINPDLELSDEQNQKLKALLKIRFDERVAIQHLIEQAWFMGEKFKVERNVLVPRPETELLVEKTLEIAKTFKNPKILDIGTGSGAIAIMLKKNAKCSVSAVDISFEALKIAQENAKTHKVEIDFFHSDLFCNVKEKFDIIISNPPYIPISQKKELEPEVLNEPSLALFAQDEKGIEVYEKIISQAPNFLIKHGHVAFELGFGQSHFVQKLLEDNGFEDIKLNLDLNGIERVICARRSYNI